MRKASTTFLLLIILLSFITILPNAFAQTVLGSSASSTNPQRSSDATTGLFSPATGTVAVSSGGTEEMRVNGTGVGIGATSPGAKLDVNAGASAHILLGQDSGSTNYNEITLNGNIGDGTGLGLTGGGTGDSNLYIGTPSGGNVYFRVNGATSTTSALTVLSGGNIGINASSPTAKLDINAAANTHILLGQDTGNSNYNEITFNGNIGDGTSLGLSGGATSDNNLYVNTPSGGGIYFRANGATSATGAMVILSSGKIGINTTTPVNLLDVHGAEAIGSSYAGTNTAPSNGLIVQGTVGIGTSSPTTGAALDIGSNTNSILLPTGTTAQRPTGVAGMLRYNSSNSVPEFYTSNWLPVPLTASSPIVINSTTGNITCPTCNTSSANVNSVSGDGSLYTNAASTGAVTLTLGNALAYSMWGNPTSSSATPSYTTSPTLSGTITDTQSIGATSSDGVVLLDPTAATSGNQKWSPRIRWTGQGWKTNVTAASQEVDAIAELQPVQGAANSSFNWVLSSQINGGGYGPLLTIPSSGGLNLNSGTYQINGTQIAASNLLNGVTGSGNIVLATSPTLTAPNIGAATGASLAVTGNITSSAGQVGVGITSPVNSLDVSGASAIGSGYAGVNTAPTNGLIVQGNVGIGTTSPGNPLSVNGIVESTTGGFKFPDGTTQTTAASSSGVIKSVHMQTFTSSGTYTPTTGMAYCLIEAVGGGGGGGGTTSTASPEGTGAPGGGGGAYGRAIFSAASIGSSQSVTVGSGGSGGAAGSNAGSSGSTTSVGSLISVSGGSGGGAGTGGGGAFNQIATGGAGGSTISGASFSVHGQAGSGGGGGSTGSSSGLGMGGAGGNSFLGLGGAMVFAHTAGNAGTGYGAGGGGAASNETNGGFAGGAGASGIIIITEYCTQ